MGRSICFKYDRDGISAVVAATVTSKIKIKGEKEACNFEEGHDKEKNLDSRREDDKRDPDGNSLLCQMDQWKRPASRGRWKEVSNVVGDLGALLKDKKSTWQKSCRKT